MLRLHAWTQRAKRMCVGACTNACMNAWQRTLCKRARVRMGLQELTTDRCATQWNVDAAAPPVSARGLLALLVVVFVLPSGCVRGEAETRTTPD